MMLVAGLGWGRHSLLLCLPAHRRRRLFDVLPSRVELEIIRVIDTPQATHIRYRVRR